MISFYIEGIFINESSKALYMVRQFQVVIDSIAETRWNYVIYFL